ncbi:PDDEXK family nuclease [Photobacterium leiognathi]|uniref:hypothetical protein n=1 Tax=Photobacterium leiognathi TaxID=553611 RepID=UPI0029818B49|nr:hypothetical protein [Photobacterium leiognathi]
MLTKIQRPGKSIPEIVRTKIVENINISLNNITTIDGKFIINDKLFFKSQNKRRPSPCVVNSANFISKKFQYELSQIENCYGETKINNQSFDGLMNVNYSGEGYTIKDKNKILELVHKYIENKKLPIRTVYTLFPLFYGMYVERGYYNLLPELNFARDLFKVEEVNQTFKVGVEFETGNIASSFRAINKLNTLFHENEIDCGCFITSNDKCNGATRIWPVSNRNGSFEELINRNYIDQISLPLVAIGFTPDGFCQDAPLLGFDGKLYTPEDTGRLNDTGEYKVLLGDRKEEILIPNL